MGSRSSPKIAPSPYHHRHLLLLGQRYTFAKAAVRPANFMGLVKISPRNRDSTTPRKSTIKVKELYRLHQQKSKGTKIVNSKCGAILTQEEIKSEIGVQLKRRLAEKKPQAKQSKAEQPFHYFACFKKSTRDYSRP